MLYLLMASLIWAFSFGLIKTSLTDLDPNTVSFTRLALSLLMFIPLLSLKKLKQNRVIAKLFFIGTIQFGVMYTAYIYSFHFLKAYEVAIFTILTPIYVTLINDLINRKRLDMPAIFSAIIAIIGAGYIVYSKFSNNIFILGVILVQASNLCFAIGQVYYKRIMHKNPELKGHNIFAVLYAGGAIFCLLMSFISGGWHNFAPNKEQISALIYLGIIASGIGFFLWNLGAVKAKAPTLAIMNNAKIPLAVLCSVLIFNETADWKRLIIGGGIMLIAVIIAEKDNIH